MSLKRPVKNNCRMNTALPISESELQGSSGRTFLPIRVIPLLLYSPVPLIDFRPELYGAIGERE